ncbi:BadF/BadG/BcrA/BcrD ATPase family protein [Streptomyces sp. NPDC087294]|uniref:BadF/BadG/BcrA/BcrD ATPase family protein n=1 Tax=Streptomyces sp. NPDC087294 TaxID=3365777 RepID=UPI003806CE9A
MSNDLNQKGKGADAAPRATASGDGTDALVVGLDAGGTRTRAVLAAASDGRTLGEGTGGPGNALTVPVAELTDHLAEALAGAVPESARARVTAVTGGFAGATGASADDPGRRHALTALTIALRRLGIHAASLGVCSDIEAAFAAAPGTPADGLALVAGTGAVAMRITGRRRTVTVDGGGWLLGDDGSGFWLGRAAVRAALRMADGRGPATTLTVTVGRALGLPEEVLPGSPVGWPAGWGAAGTAGGAGAAGGAGTGAAGGSGGSGGAGGVDGSGVPGVLGAAGGAGGASASGGAHGSDQPGGASGPRGSKAANAAGGPGGSGGSGGPDAASAAGEVGAAGWTRPSREAYRMLLLPVVMADAPIRLARFAPLVAEAAQGGDPVALGLLEEAADQLAAAVMALAPGPGERVVATGGLLGPDGPLTAPLTERLSALGLPLDWVADGCRGAVALARLDHGGTP